MLSICIKALYNPPFLNLHLNFLNFLNATQQSRQIQENKIKIKVANFGMKYISETMVELISVFVGV